MLIRYGYEITISCPRPTALVCMMSVQADRLQDLQSPETAETAPYVEARTYHDVYGNLCRRLVAPAGDITLRGDATIRDGGALDPVLPDAPETPVAALPDGAMLFLMGSRYCETDRLSQTAWDLFGGTAPGWARVQAICDFVHRHIRFDYQRARSTRSAFEAYEEGVGVCRDFAHLAVAFCRCMNIPARYVNGHLGDIGVPVVDPMDFSAWIEVFLDGAWRTFDPRNNVPRIGRIVVARGRDAADVAMIHELRAAQLAGVPRLDLRGRSRGAVRARIHVRSGTAGTPAVRGGRIGTAITRRRAERGSCSPVHPWRTAW